ncbi:unnamed protein product [Effrenium voratum]|uniref:Uncharacterized protein n=1 Tax=Effrenium voratum TaxID=2562239 RepID=A0AA36JAR4_9DINO|nr:unnamed protein product [Effrenium voratum]
MSSQIEEFEELLQLNEDFWGKFKDMPSMALATEKEDVLMILQNFALIRKRHNWLFQLLKATVHRTLDAWTAPELAALCQSFGELLFLHEDLLLAMAPQVLATGSMA